MLDALLVTNGETCSSVWTGSLFVFCRLPFTLLDIYCTEKEIPAGVRDRESGVERLLKGFFRFSSACGPSRLCLGAMIAKYRGEEDVTSRKEMQNAANSQV